jgi:hypothetical protein
MNKKLSMQNKKMEQTINNRVKKIKNNMKERKDKNLS